MTTVQANADRLMTSVRALSTGVEVNFADGRSGVIDPGYRARAEAAASRGRDALWAAGPDRSATGQAGPNISCRTRRE